jgi:transcriptional regulator with XRE-family HTH domain
MEKPNDIKVKSRIDLRLLMRKMGMRTNAFAEACGMSTQSMAQFLRKDKSLTTQSIYRMAGALGIDPREMFFPTDENNETYMPAETSPQDALTRFDGFHSAVQKAKEQMQCEELRFAPEELEGERGAVTKEDCTVHMTQAQEMRTVAFCPHCGARVKVGVVLLAD